MRTVSFIIFCSKILISWFYWKICIFFSTGSWIQIYTCLTI